MRELFVNIITRRKKAGLVLAGLLAATTSMSVVTAGAANATATTCITAYAGLMCNQVDGYGNVVQQDKSFYDKAVSFGPICNANAWFFYILPSGQVYSRGYASQPGCVYWGSVTLTLNTNNTVPYGTQVCSKFYTDGWANFVGQKCVGIS